MCVSECIVRLTSYQSGMEPHIMCLRELIIIMHAHKLMEFKVESVCMHFVKWSAMRMNPSLHRKMGITVCIQHTRPDVWICRKCFVKWLAFSLFFFQSMFLRVLRWCESSERLYALLGFNSCRIVVISTSDKHSKPFIWHMANSRWRRLCVSVTKHNHRELQLQQT